MAGIHVALDKADNHFTYAVSIYIVETGAAVQRRSDSHLRRFRRNRDFRILDPVAFDQLPDRGFIFVD
jgi:hypothetical protein